ncbi:FUSC family protein [Streptomyces sp. NPDC059255]|uniref:FUSC family protein n=1 Tax=Streptomyces sp. NPDC059255 TaxID=3346793 RepID=UPI00367DF7C0
MSAAAVCLAAHLLDGPRGYWLPLGVAFISKPDLGPVPRRALHRCLETVLGVTLVGTVLPLTRNDYVLMALVVVCGMVLAVGVCGTTRSARSHSLRSCSTSSNFSATTSPLSGPGRGHGDRGRDRSDGVRDGVEAVVECV